ncbi:MAG: DUF6714 family protein [Myxococcota bacterium]
MITELEQLLAVIERAFDGVPFAGPNHRSLHQAEAIDHYAKCDQGNDHTGRWQDLPDAHLVACQWALPYLDAVSLQYYLPAVLSFAVRSALPRWRPEGAGYIYDSIRHQLDFWTRRDSDRIARLTRPQLDAVVTFARFYGGVPPEVIHRWEALRG